MPVATSPYQQNDYQAASQFQPYRLNVQQTAQTAMALDAFWKMGARRVKSAYDSALNLNLTSEENREVKKKLLEDAQKQLTKLSSMDLSNADVQRQGLGIFKPIFEDKDIMMDDHLTTLKQNIFAEADRFRRDPKTKGAGFHMDNLAYALKGFQGFNSKTPRGGIEGIFEAAKDSQYIPFYDDTKEKLELLKACTADKMSNTAANGPYMRSVSDASKTESKIWGCLDSGLSLQSRQQARIAGTIRYGNDYNAVRQDYIDAASGQLKHYTNEKALLVAKQEALKKAPDSQDKEEQLAAMDTRIGQYDEGISKINEQLNGANGFNNWSDQYVKDHYEDLATTAFFRRSTQAFASSFATTDRTEADKPNPIWITERTQYGQDRRAQYAQESQDARQAAGFQHDVEMENLKYMHKLLSGDEKGEGKDPIAALKQCANTPGCNPAKFGSFELKAITEDPTTSQKLKAQITDLEGARIRTIKDLAADPTIGKMISHLGLSNATNITDENYNKMWEVLNTYANNSPKDSNGNLTDVTALKIVKATNDLLQIDNEKDMLSGVYEDAAGKVLKTNPEIAKSYNDKRAKILSQIKPVQLSNGVMLSADRIANIVEGGDPEYSISTSQGSTTGTGSIAGNYSQSTTNYQVRDKNGKVVLASLPVADALNVLNKSRDSSYKGEIDKVIAGNTIVQHMGLAVGNIFTKGSLGLRNLETMFGQSLGIIDDNQPGPGKVVFNSTSVDPVTGEVVLEASKIGTGGESDQVSYQEMRDALNKNNVGNAVYKQVPGNDNKIIIKLPSLVGTIQAPTYGEKIRKQLDYYETKVPSMTSAGVVVKVGRSKDGNLYSVRVGREIGGDNPSYTILVNGIDKDGKPIEKELPFRNLGGINDKENIILQLNNLLTGTLDK